MQDRGLVPSVIENTIGVGTKTPSRGGTTVHYDPVNNVSVVTNKQGKVVTVKYGK
jgi:filamentous hemagglutinin